MLGQTKKTNNTDWFVRFVEVAFDCDSNYVKFRRC